MEKNMYKKVKTKNNKSRRSRDMKKIGILFLSLLMVVGCSFNRMTAKDAVVEYMNMYIDNNEEVLNQLDEYTEKEQLTEKQKETYKEIMKNQYKHIKYDITNEEYDGNTATVTVKLTVYDLYKVQKEADQYLLNNHSEFYDEMGTYDNTLFLDYKLEKMKAQTDTIEYTINFVVEKDNDKWTVKQLTNSELEKIHGIYNYEE